ncbi:RNA polymerase factor sigma-54 [Wielerella bovis]|uniref:RNA polymerase factor sigma-54 n=1 Tax=Wielerella bovis TaxID=2917790 RepID=UPI00201A1CE3|nr:RNA polymerase factor sigma-54 [Wielerella bovis]ULJ64228.1 RNA polymerase factor sigma-54 [Wielerella bovis]ULJ67853.1 RNA polymerase factor sigma-54 [Wielerella bovis]
MSATNFQLKLRQTQQLSQNMQQSLRVLQMSGIEIEREVEDWLADNPLLERKEQPENPYEPPRQTVDIAKRGISLDDDDSSAWENLAEEETLNAYLHKQVSEHPLSPTEAAHVHILIDFLDDRGYLTDSIADIIDHTPLEWMLSEEDMEIALENLQRFDPAGIATANLNQSLLHQLDRLPLSPARRCAAQIVMYHLEKLTPNQPKNINRLAKILPDFSDTVLKDALDMISSLNPYPSYGFASEEPTQYVRPDVIVEQGEHGWLVVGNDDAAPQIQINTELVEMLQDEEAIDPVWREKINSAKQKMDMLQQRKNTVIRVAEYIVERQQDFFFFGEIGLVPMLLKDCATHLGLAESTISRAVSNKYLFCPQGLFALRFFFSQNAISSENSDEAISANAIKSVIAQIVERENKQKPYSDCALHDLLQQQGIKIARRTVAKYREQLGIPTVQQRRQL